ncbi:MAG: pantoate--beta-alanine ligase [Gammaproteobacteria bacterium]
MMIVIDSLSKWKNVRSTIESDKEIGFVPTMGDLHPGHISLIERSKAQNEVTVLSIFVNPTQFDDIKDFSNYRRTLEEDLSIAKSQLVDYVLVPNVDEMYHDNYNYQVKEQAISSVLEGEHRKGHFEGVLTVVMKLLLLVKPHRAYFGEKDYQQLCLIQAMVEAFFLDIKIVPCPTVRENSGLAMSSRNGRLSSSDRKKAAFLYECLSLLNDEIEIANRLTKNGFVVEYIKQWQGRMFGAVQLNGVRLIDNCIIECTIPTTDHFSGTCIRSCELRTDKQTRKNEV